MDNQELWRAVLGELELTLSKANFKTWLKDTSILSHEGDKVVIGVPNIFSKEWLGKRFYEPLITALEKHAGITKVDFKIASPQSQKKQASAAPTKQVAADLLVNTKTPQRPVAQPGRNASHPMLNPKYTFDTFVVGSSNELAYAASQAVSKNPGHKYNPLFLYGGVGLGKTHLMQAIGNAVLAADPSKRIEYVTSEDFTNDLVSSIRNKKTQDFAKRFRNVDVLIIDDMQFLGGKEKMQEEFFHTFNTLHQANKQIIMSSDRQPRAIPMLDDRLRSRFESGMTADVQAPDLETRAAIIQKKAASQNFMISNEVVIYMAQHVKQNIRELEGALTQVIAHCELRGAEPTIPLVSAILGTRVNTQSKNRRVSPKQVVEKVAAYYDLKSDDIVGPKRGREIVVPRQVAMYIMRHELSLSFPKIGSACGGRDHTTAMHSVEKIEKLLESDETLREEVQAVSERVLA